MMKRTRLLFLVAVCVWGGCALPRRQDPVIDAYKSAACLPLVAVSRVQPPVREWDALVRPSGVVELSISGYQAPGGRVVALDSRTGRTHVVADAGDYVYPADVRTGADSTRVYVKADGLAAGRWKETWLFEYDLTQFRQLNRVRVDPSVLPPECPGGPET